MEIEVISPKTINEVLDILKEKKDGLKILGGGTDLVVRIKERTMRPSCLLDLSRVSELQFIEDRGEYIAVGSTVKIGELVESKLIKEKVPVLHEAARVFGSPQIRNLATIGGNIGNSSPVADTMPALYVHRASLILKKKGGEREVPIEEFQTGPGTNILEKDELIAEIRVPKVRENEKGFFFKLGQRKALIIAKVSVAALLELDGNIVKNVRIALGAVAPRVIRAEKTEKFLMGRELDEDTMKEAAHLAAQESTPITDLRSTESYRRYMVGSLLYKGLKGLMECSDM